MTETKMHSFFETRCSNLDFESFDPTWHRYLVWLLSRQCEIPWKFHGISLTACGTPAHAKYHASTSVIVMVGVGMQQCMIRNQNEMHKLNKVNGRKYAALNSFRPLFPDKIFRFTWHLVKSLKAVKFPDISRFSREVVTL